MATYTLRIDSTPPTLSYSNGPDQGRWYASAQSIDVSSQGAAGLAPVALISCTLAGHTTTYPGDQAHITVPSPGGSLVCQAQDQAGNRSPSQAWQFLIDTTPPTGYFAPSDPHNPAAVAVQTADSQSGVAGGEIDIQLAAGWQRLATAYDPSSGELTATVPDDGSIPDGTYPLRAIVLDAVGNQATITTDANGTPQTVSLPLRNVTQLHVGDSSVLTRRCTLKRATLPSGKHHVSGQRARAKLVKHCTTVAVPRANGPLTLSFGQRASVQGLLQTADGEPIAGALVTVSAQPPGWPSQPAGSVTTDLQGHFTYQIAPGPSRTITFAFPATSTLRGASATTTVLVAGKATIAASTTARAGQALRLSGEHHGRLHPAARDADPVAVPDRRLPARMAAVRRARPHPPQRRLEHHSPATPRRRRTHLPIPRRDRQPERLALHPRNHQRRLPPRAHLTRPCSSGQCAHRAWPMATPPGAGAASRRPRCRDRVGERWRVCDAAS